MTLLILIALIVFITLQFPFIYSSLLTSLFYSYIIYQIFFRPELFFSFQVNSNGSNRKYALSLLSEDELSSIRQVLETYLKTEKVFLNAQISLPDVAKELNISAHHISQAVNRQKNSNFNELINRYRIEHACKIILNPEFRHYTMEAIGNMAGFKTRQTFISAFKKVHNYPPSEYLKIHRHKQLLTSMSQP
jgi:AraC-like DNA-binding protein